MATNRNEANLQETLAVLSRLSAGVGPNGLVERLNHVARLAVAAIPGADGAGVTLSEPKRVDTIVATTDVIGQVDSLQYELGEGPCITAVRTNRTIRSGSLGSEPAWRRFGTHAAELGVHSVLSVPLATHGQVIGSMNVYARARDAFDDRAAELAQAFAVPAAISVQHAQALFQAQRLATELQSALSHRAVIDQAIGIVMSRTGDDPEAAFDRLRVQSQAEHRKLYLVAQEMVEDAVRRAQSVDGAPDDQA